MHFKWKILGPNSSLFCDSIEGNCFQIKNITYTKSVKVYAKNSLTNFCIYIYTSTGICDYLGMHGIVEEAILGLNMCIKWKIV